MKTHRTCYITEDQYRRLLLMEDKMTDTIKRYIRANNPFTEQQLATPVAELDPQMRDSLRQYEGAAFDTCVAQGFNLLAFLRLCFLKRFGIERGKGPSEYYLGLARIGLQELGMFTRTDTDNEVTELRNIAAYMHSSEDPNVKNTYDSNFNGLPFKDLAAKIEPFMKRDLDNDKNRLMNVSLSNNDYHIVPIYSYDEASKYSQYTSWCVTHGKGHFDTYTAGGNRFYFCLQDGFENIPEQATENCPLDTYGLSMIAVLVDTQGKPVHITTRWNHDHDGEDNPNFHTAQQFQEITHINFYNTFKPYTDEELSNMGIITFDKVQPLLDAGTPIERIFTDTREYGNGYIRVLLNNKENIIDPNKKLIFDTWLDYIYPFNDNGLIKIDLNGKTNFANFKGEILSDTWFDSISWFNDGAAIVGLNNTWNYINAQGKLIANTWFDDAEAFGHGWGKVCLNDKYNYINLRGEFLSKIWFHRMSDFKDGLSMVSLDKKINFINSKGQLISKDWFDGANEFVDGVALVYIDDKCNFINTKGRLISDIWFDDAEDFSDGLCTVCLNNKWNVINTDGKLISNTWFDYVSDFYKGYADVELNNKYNAIDTNGQLKFPQWFTNIEDMDTQGLNEKLNLKVRNIIQESLQKQKEQISNTNGIINLYQSTTEEKLERMKASPMFSAEYFGAGGGNMHTRAVYANLDIRQTAKLNYGNVIVHLEFHATWDKILCINRYVSKKYCGGKDIIEQLKNFPKLYSLVMESQYLVDKLKRSYTSGDGESMAIVALCEYLGSIKKRQMMDNNDDMRNIAHKSSGVEHQDFSHAILTEFGVEGFVYYGDYGDYDGMCCIPLNADKVIPVEYAISQRRPADLNKIQWQSFNTQYDAGQVNHIQAFMSKFGNEYVWDRNERSYLNTVLVKKRSDNLFYYLDTMSGESVFPIGFYDARPFDPTFKKAWVQIYDDSHPMFIDRNGGLYRTVRGRQVSDLYLWMRQDNELDNDEENSLDGFSFLPGELD